MFEIIVGLIYVFMLGLFLFAFGFVCYLCKVFYLDAKKGAKANIATPPAPEGGEPPVVKEGFFARLKQLRKGRHKEENVFVVKVNESRKSKEVELAELTISSEGQYIVSPRNSLCSYLADPDGTVHGGDYKNWFRK